MSRQKSDWADLYPEILTQIANRLQTKPNLINFISTCTNWKSSIPKIPKNLPLLSPNYPLPIPQTTLFPDLEHPLYISQNTTFLFHPPCKNLKPWLVTVEEFTPGKLILRTPLTRKPIQNYPEGFRNVLVDETRVSVITKGFNFRSNDEYVGKFSKVIMYGGFALVIQNDSLIFVDLKNVENYGYLRHSRVSCFDDIVRYREKVVVIDRKGRVYVVEMKKGSFKLSLFCVEGVCAGCVSDSNKRLVSSREGDGGGEGGLYLIDRYHDDELIYFRVYKLDEEGRKWVEVKSLDGRIMIVSSDACFFVSAEDLPGCKGNSIFFPKGHFRVYSGSFYPDYEYFRKASKELKIGVFCLDDGESGMVSGFRGYSRFFWPPPKWVYPGSSPSEWAEEEDQDQDEVDRGLEELLIVNDVPMVDCQEQQFTGVTVPWDDFPSILLREIVKHLRARIDVCRFRAVCKKWRTSIPVPPDSNPFFSLLPKGTTEAMVSALDPLSYTGIRKSPVLSASTIYLLQPCSQSLLPQKSWLVTVEELEPGRLFLRLPLKRIAIEKLPESFPKVFDLSDIRVTEIGREFCLRYTNSNSEMFSDWRSFFTNTNKVVVRSNDGATPPTTDILALNDRGDLISVRDGKSCSTVRCGPVTRFDDIIIFKGEMYAIDRKGRAYIIQKFSVSRVVNDTVSSSGIDRKKRLAELRGDLYLVTKYTTDDQIFFRIYKLNEEKKWDEVESLDDKILFVTQTACVFVSARDFPGWRGNCVVFPTDCMSTYTGNFYPDWRFFKRTAKELQIAVCYLGDKGGARLIKSFPGYSDLFWPPPAWIPLSSSLSSGMDCDKRDEEQLSSSLQPSQEEEIPPQTPEPAVEAQIVQNPESGVKETAASDSTCLVPSPAKDNTMGASTVPFLGVEVRSELQPILQKVWDKHGNVAKKSAVRSQGTLARALESLAEVVVILKETPGKDLSESQAEILSVTLSDLKLMQFRVDWLAPFVEKALLCRKAKPLVDDLEQCASLEAKCHSMMMNVRAMEREVVMKTRSLTDRLNALGPVDLEKCPGEELC